MIAIHAQTERKRLDRSVRCAEKRRPWARKQRLRGLIRPDPAVCATAGAACGRKSLSSARIQAIFTSNDTPLGECRLIALNVIEFQGKRRRDSEEMATIAASPKPELMLAYRQYRQTQNIEQVLHIVNSVLIALLIAVLTA